MEISHICQTFALKQAFADLVMPVEGFLISLLSFRVGVHLLKSKIDINSCAALEFMSLSCLVGLEMG